MLSDFVQLDQIRNQNLQEQGYICQSKLKKPIKYKKWLFLLFLAIIMSLVSFMCVHFQKQPQLEIDIQINKEIKKVLCSNRSFERLSQSEREQEININKINQEIDNREEQGKYLEKKERSYYKWIRQKMQLQIDQFNLTQLVFCQCIQQESSIMIIANDNDIDVYQFKDGQIQLIQTLRGHKYDVATGYFMKNSNYFISGSSDNTIQLYGKLRIIYDKFNISLMDIKIGLIIQQQILKKILLHLLAKMELFYFRRNNIINLIQLKQYKIKRKYYTCSQIKFTIISYLMLISTIGSTLFYVLIINFYLIHVYFKYFSQYKIKKIITRLEYSELQINLNQTF
ncbi:unnamed protein product [Paramecium sonneborni]|uniref:Uncharacterized protein n=1 Tax=Paramecium sonneborni TaxID=65129 RepID=A0A8S1QVW1_9CILI|nr:unnamed protein product [Paramecium sonneborni]